jgi:hypothetical protein
MSSSDPELQVREALARTGALREGHFVLTSGRHSDSYIQCSGDAVRRSPSSRDRNRSRGSSCGWGIDLRFRNRPRPRCQVHLQ